jgi:hypothetical protein
MTRSQTTLDKTTLQAVYDKIDARRELERSYCAQTEHGDNGEVVGMGYCLDIILAMQRETS